jgi:NAD+ kinase
VRVPVEDAEAIGIGEVRGVADPTEPATGEVGGNDLAEGATLAISLGGDGTMLRTVALVAAHRVPVIGVNLGQLGYLTDVEPAGLVAALERFAAGDHRIEERMLLEVVVERRGVDGAPPSTSGRWLALNEAVLEKTLAGHTVRLDVAIDGTPFTPYETDALIVATPTGSTAYAFSARGPIVSPTHRLLLLTPVSPHMLFDRTLVLEPDTEVRIAVARDRPAALSIDGQPGGDLGPGDAVVCRAAPEPLALVRFGTADFTRILKAKFGLNDR